jgi:hypothetical protein
MSLVTLEKAIVFEAIKVSGIETLKRKNLMEWRTGKDNKLEVREGEKMFYLPSLGLECVFKV